MIDYFEMSCYAMLLYEKKISKEEEKSMNKTVMGNRSKRENDRFLCLFILRIHTNIF